MNIVHLFSVCIAMAVSVVYGDQRSVVEVRSRYKSCDPFACYYTTNQGSGVVIGERDGLPVVATCLHILGNRNDCRVSVNIDGSNVAATVIGHSVAMDTAFLRLDSPVAVTVVDVEATPEPSDVDVIGFPDGRKTTAKAKYVRRDRSGNLIANKPTRQGQSGGGLFGKGKLLGLVKWTDSQQSYSVPGCQIIEMADHYKVKMKAKVKAKSLVIAHAPPPPPELPPLPDAPPFTTPDNSDLNRKLDSLTERLAGLEAAIARIPSGKNGTNGKDADPSIVAGIDKRLRVLESRGQTVQLIDESGTVVSEQTYAAGSPIKLQFNPVK